MKFRLTFKTPDVVDQLDDAGNLPGSVEQVIKKFVEYGEYITVEFDSETQTAIVVEA